MMSRQTWSSISVYDFFRTYNWTGEKIPVTPLKSKDLSHQSEDLFSLNLGEFLLKSNWTGKQEKGFTTESLQLSNESLLSLSVRNFFQSVVWKSNPNIAPVAKPHSASNLINSSSTDLDLDNLSNLF